MKHLSVFFALGFLILSCDYAQAAALQPAASFMVGHAMTVDGGLLAG